jgi:Tol biopolymer transport system component
MAIVDVAAGTLTSIGSTTELPTGEVVFSPDGRSIAFSRFDAEGGVELASIGFDGGSPIELPRHLEGEMPTFSPDGRFLAFCKRVTIGINRPLARFVRRLSDGYTEQVLPPEQYPTLGCINDWVT